MNKKLSYESVIKKSHYIRIVPHSVAKLNCERIKEKIEKNIGLYFSVFHSLWKDIPAFTIQYQMELKSSCVDALFCEAFNAQTSWQP